jgi:hypothetical protein
MDMRFDDVPNVEVVFPREIKEVIDIPRGINGNRFTAGFIADNIVMDRLQGTEFLNLIGKDRIFLSTHLAMGARKQSGQI